MQLLLISCLVFIMIIIGILYFGKRHKREDSFSPESYLKVWMKIDTPWSSPGVKMSRVPTSKRVKVFSEQMTTKPSERKQVSPRRLLFDENSY